MTINDGDREELHKEGGAKTIDSKESNGEGRVMM